MRSLRAICKSKFNELRGNFSKQEESLRRNLNNDMRSILGSFFQNQASTSGTLSSNTIPNPKGEMKAITTRSGVAYERPSIPTNPSPKKVVERETEETTDMEQINFQGSTAHIQPPMEDFDPEGDICLIENLLNEYTFQLPPIDLTQVEVTKAYSSIEEPPELELKDLPSHLEYAYLEGNDKLPVIISKSLTDDEKESLLKVLKSHKRAIAWKITDIKGIDPRFCTYKIGWRRLVKPRGSKSKIS
ncbi:hypothetical protein Tco_0110978 [Tanacetum coccineum]